MKVFVTVGTTPFESLIMAADKSLGDEFDATFQISSGRFVPANHDYFRFVSEIETWYQSADVVVSHGGAGTIFRLLELGKRVVIVPNLERTDHHQTDICNYMEAQNHAVICRNLNKLVDSVITAHTQDFSSYEPENFSGILGIRNYLSHS